jgi:uncharacterized integral membrane protein (TIGR00698 family)
LAVATGVAAVATAVGRFAPVVGAPVTAIVIGAVIAAVAKPGERLRPGITTAAKPVLQIAVVALGAQLSLLQVVRVGAGSLPVMLGTLAVCLAAAVLLGRWMGIKSDLRTLIGAGTGICGASAIAAVAPVIAAVETDIAYAVSTIFVFNVTAVLVFPTLGHLLGMGQESFGLFAGTAVNDMSSVVAAASVYGHAAADHAVVVKLVRTLLIIPICIGLAAIAARRARGRAQGANADADDTAAVAPKGVRPLKLVPWFLVGFLILAAVNTVGVIPAGAHDPLNTLAVFLITVALAGIGLSTDLAGLRRAGHRPLLLGAALWVIVTVTSLGLQYAFGGGVLSSAAS